MRDYGAGWLERILKPARYTGGEWNSVIKNPDEVECRIALAMPDIYEVGMSNLGLKILYEVVNAMPGVMAERVYAPWTDMEAELRQQEILLSTLETATPLQCCDMIGFSLQYELSYSNVLNMLDLAGIPLRSGDRSLEHPLIVGGGPCAYNPEPVADFFDLFILGEGEEVLPEVITMLRKWRKDGCSGGRAGVLQLVAHIPGVYVPSLYEVEYETSGLVRKIFPREGAPHQVNKRVLKDLDNAPYIEHPIVPFMDVVHDRVLLELFRGCTRGCRFCQAGYVYRPVRERRPETLEKLVDQLLKATGYNEISLTSLSSADYSCLQPLVRTLVERYDAQKVSVSLPSLRIDSFSVDLAQEVQKVRKSSLTFAPEAGTQRMRDVINKGVTEADLEAATRSAFQAGWSQVKLYFMLGLPTETDEDLTGIIQLAGRVIDIYREVKGRRGAKVTVSVSSFVPKAHTALQWMAQDTIEEIERKQRLLKSIYRDKNISLNYHDAQTSFLEGVFARGDRRLGAVLQRAWEKGVKFDGWSELFRYDLWQEAFAEVGVDPSFYANRLREKNEILPWDHLSAGIEKEFLWREYEAALKGDETLDCRRGTCTACGVCPNLGVAICDWESEHEQDTFTAK